MDKARGDLLNGTWIEIYGDEVESVQAAAPWELEQVKETEKYHIELAVFHDLHCVICNVTLSEASNELTTTEYDTESNVSRLLQYGAILERRAAEVEERSCKSLH